MDAKQACDKLNGFNFQSRYLVGTIHALFLTYFSQSRSLIFSLAVLYHQPEKMAKSKEDLAARRESLAQLKQQHGID